ncbi:MAG: heparan-alpha-glucosaminide N-acetyltransferase domain-containing protein [Prevotellaceae bacterium]|jgi:predicted acyltransferase|nr:heparan-alpha-glucosaminide N-acetyltransferase domain-containing protein [Prevotellaceae bacterium]
MEKKRYVALDILRGMTVACMILVNNPGGKAFAPLRHAEWHGCTPTDLVFPFFLFIVGAAMAFSFAKFSQGLSAPAIKKLVIRGFLIFATGFLLQAFPFYPLSPKPDLSWGANYLNYLNNLRVFGVLQRIGLAYILGGFLAIWLQKPKRIAWGAITVLLLHWVTLYLFGGDDPYSKEGNISGQIDVWIVGKSHVYKGFGLPFDPEGLLGVLSAAGTVLLGYLAGGLIRRDKPKIDTVGLLYTISLVCIGLGIIWGIWLPINKPLWTGSYVLYTAGWSTLLLAFFIYLTDVVGSIGKFSFEKLLFPFKALGANPLFAFVMAGILARIARIFAWQAGESKITFLQWFNRHVVIAIFGNNEVGSLVYSLCYVSVFTLMAIFLYRKKIFIRL